MSEFWELVRREFVLDPLRVNLAALAIAPHHREIDRAVDSIAGKLDRHAWPFLSEELIAAERRVREAAAAYFGARADQIALVSSTTEGLALLYAGVRIRPDQEILTSSHEYFGTFRCLASRQEREGRHDFVRTIVLFDDLPNYDEESVLCRIKESVRPTTRVLALTWVYSNTGVKLPIAKIGRWVKEENETRPKDDRIILCVDGVHGFGVENTTFDDLHCHFFVAGCHKWLFGPRGTGVWVGTDDAWAEVLPIIPSTTAVNTPGSKNTPGGLHSYELRWALDLAFDFLRRRVGKQRIEERVHDLSSRVKSALRQMAHVRLVTPLSPDHSAGIVCFDVRDRKGEPVDALAVVDRLEAAGIVATTSSENRAFPDRIHVRLALSILNTDPEVERAIAAIQDLVSADWSS